MDQQQDHSTCMQMHLWVMVVMRNFKARTNVVLKKFREPDCHKDNYNDLNQDFQSCVDGIKVFVVAPEVVPAR